MFLGHNTVGGVLVNLQMFGAAEVKLHCASTVRVGLVSRSCWDAEHSEWFGM